jgi:PhnB protein
MSVSPIPEGYHSATPYLIIRDAAAAIDFYRQAFGAAEVMRLADPAGNVMHAEIKVGDSVIMISEESPEWGNLSPSTLGGSSAAVHLYVEDVDALTSRAVEAGAEVLIPVSDQFYGDRAGRLADPFGHLWIVSTHQEDMTVDEIARRAAEYMEQRDAP